MSLKKRWNSPTPKFWKKVRNIAIGLGTAGTVAATLSQLTVEDTKVETP